METPNIKAPIANTKAAEINPKIITAFQPVYEQTKNPDKRKPAKAMKEQGDLKHWVKQIGILINSEECIPKSAKRSETRKWYIRLDFESKLGGNKSSLP